MCMQYKSIIGFIASLPLPIIIITILALFSCIICVMKNKQIGVFYTMIATIFIILICQYMLNIDLGLKDFVWTDRKSVV